MNDLSAFSSLEDKIRAVTAVPCARDEFVDRLQAKLMERGGKENASAKRSYALRPAWVVFMVAIGVMLAVTLIIGPQKVYAAVLRLFGYIPGVGIVDQSIPIRVLAEPVSVTREGVTISVNSVTLTGTQTVIDYGIAGVPLSAYPAQEVVQSCISPVDSPYLRLPDGTILTFTGNLAGPVPSTVQEAIFVLPCIFDTLPGTVPTDWELPLRFVAAPPDLTVQPVIELTPTSVQTQTEAATATVSFEQAIQTNDGYILIGELRPQLPLGSWLQEIGVPVIHDANGTDVPYTIPNDLLPYSDGGPGQGGFSWAFQFQASTVTFPLTITFTGVTITQVDQQASAELAFDAGSSPQAGQEWQINQDVQLGAYSLRLVSITANGDGYSFRIRPGSGLVGADVQIEGYQAVGGGGGGSDGARVEEFTTSLAYTDLPKGKLTLIFSNPLSASASETWQGQWQPEVPVSEWPVTTPDSTLPVCLPSGSQSSLPALPAGLDGRFLLTELDPELNLVLASFDGDQRQILVAGGGRGVLSPDGQRVAYPASDGTRIVDISTGDTILASAVVGYSLSWSPDGQQLAIATGGGPYGIFVADADGSSQRQLTDLGYEVLAGWSPDGTQLYYAIPSSSNDGFLLRSITLPSGDIHDLFVLEDSSRKAPMPAISPDGNWIAYRGSDNGSLYIVRIDGTQGRLVVEKPYADSAISGIAWGPDGGLIAVSMISPEAPDGELLLIQWQGCEAYRIPGLHGKLYGLLIP